MDWFSLEQVMKSVLSRDFGDYGKIIFHELLLNTLRFSARGAIMHLTFDQQPAKSKTGIVSDESGNKNDAGLVNGAAISNRTMGMEY